MVSALTSGEKNLVLKKTTFDQRSTLLYTSIIVFNDTMDNQPLTKKDLHEAIEEFAAIVNTGLQGVHNEMHTLNTSLEAKLNAKIDDVKHTLNAKIDDVKTELLDSNAAIAKQLEDSRAEQAAVIGGRQRIDDTLLTHGDTLVAHSRRISVLEGKAVGV